MNLQELYEAAAPGLTPRDTNNLKTSLKYLAHALGKPDAAHCQPGDYLEPWPALKAYLDTFFSSWRTPPSAATIYNTRRNLRLLFQQPAAQESEITPDDQGRWRGVQQIQKEIHAAALYSHRLQGEPYKLPFKQWPKYLQQGWKQYHHQVSLRIRDKTMTGTLELLECYVGYLIGIHHARINHWHQLFEVVHVDAYVRWVATRHHVRMTRIGERVVERLSAIANVLELPHLAALRRYKHSLPMPEPMHDKDDTTVVPEDLERTGMILLGHARQPYQVNLHHKHPGLQHALLFARGLILRLLARHPLRARNIVELQRETHLHREHGIWTLRFRGEDLKVSERGKQTSRWRGPWPPDLVKDLEEYLNDYRPKLPGADKTRYIFLTRSGRPYTQCELRRNLNIAMIKCTGKRFYTHLARHIYATHMRDQGVEVETVAYMLNNTPQVVYENYYRTRENFHYTQAHNAIQRILKKTSDKSNTS